MEKSRFQVKFVAFFLPDFIIKKSCPFKHLTF